MKNFSLVLGSGGIKGIAHLGVLKRLEEKQLIPDVVIGSSMGALVGAFYCVGFKSDEIKELLFKSRSLKLIDFSGFKESLIHGNKIDAFLKKHLDLDFKDLKIPLIVNAIDLRSGAEIKLNKGKVYEAVRASISIPGVFKPVEKDNMVLVDAGFTDPIPFKFIPKSKQVIVVDVSSALMNLDSNIKLFDILRQSFYITQKNAATRTKILFLKTSKKPKKLTYLELDLSNYSVFSFMENNKEYEKIINFGYKKAKELF
jgi:NTE family protein